MVHVFSINIFDVLDPRATLSFVTPLVDIMFNVLPDGLIEPYLVNTFVGYSIVAKRVYRSFSILFLNKVMLSDPVEINMFDFDVLLGIVKQG